MVHVHVGDHDVGHRREGDTGGFQSVDQLPGPREAGKLLAQPAIDEDGLVAAARYGDVQRPIEHVRSQEHMVEPRRPSRRSDIGGHGLGRQGQDAVADDQDVDLADLERVARRNQLFGSLLNGV